MSDIAELERRISAALERIEAGLDRVDAMPAAAPVEARDDAEVERLREELEAERTANAQLTERVRAIKDKQETMVGALEKKVERLTMQLNAAGEDAQRLRQFNEELTESNRALAAAAEKGVVEPGLINRALMTELEAMRAARAAEMAEMDEILSELKPLIGEVA